MIKIFFILALMFSFSFADARAFFSSPTTGTAGASALVLAQNNLRTYLIIQNTGSTSIIAKFGSAISGSNEGIVIPAGGNYEPIEAPASSLYLKAVSGSPTYVIIQGN